MEKKRTYGVWAVRSSTSIFGPAQSWCKENGKPLEFDEVHFLSQLRELEKAAMEESPDIKEKVAGIISTYHIRPEDKKRDSEVFQELVSLGRISHEGPSVETRSDL